jgi:hypothetical protein
MATDLLYSSSPASSNCSQLAFPVDLPDQLTPGSYAASLQCDTRSLDLPKALAIVAPPTVSLGATQLVLPPSNKAVVLQVQLSGPAVVPLSVSLAVDDPNVKVVSGGRTPGAVGQREGGREEGRRLSAICQCDVGVLVGWRPR